MLNSPRPKNWWVYPRLTPEVDAALNIFPPYMRQLLFNRGCNDASSAAEYLNATQPIGDPFLLTDMETAITRLLHAIDQSEAIVVYGDYDVDGVSATALMVQVLQKFTPKVTRYIPNRFDEGYGVNKEAIQLLADSGAKLILTVDCGIRSPEEVELASSLGVEMIISDHHYPQGDLPPALAVICPKREGDAYPDKDLAGVGLAYKIAQALFARRKAGDWSAEDWLDFVALGTVADVVPLHGENRVLVRRGINLIRQGKRVGLQALIRVSGRDPQRISAGDIGYMLGPRLNAAGRMESALQAYSLLMAESLDDAAMLAQKLDNQNSERQKVTKEMRAMAEDHFGPEPEFDILTTFDEAYNAGVMGLVATSLVEAYYRPAIVGSIEGDVIRASCRSIEEFHITQALDQCSDLLVRHGGHSMAAGFTLERAKVDEFLERIQAVAAKQLAGRELRKTVKADMEMPIEQVKDIQLRDLEKLQPTGMENPDAVFISRNVEIKVARTIGAEKKHLKLTCQAGHYLLDAVAWRQADWLPMLPGKFDLLYNIEENNYMGSRSLQLNVRDMRPSKS
ncbi:MAG: single-stranded-DNA-specific exonuclease RecJ [Anaerolineaceae bacterium]|nr:single-stranded-DNA-specific exonuclease RecJ [Anaerolineaceae bacterium]